MSYFRSSSLLSIHNMIGKETMEWKDLNPSSTLLRYCFKKGISHLIQDKSPRDAEALMSNFIYGFHRLELLNATGVLRLVKDMKAVVLREGLMDKKSFEAWEEFFRMTSHLLMRGNQTWGSEKILLQLAVEQADDSPITLSAEEWLKTGACDWVWMKRSTRPASLEENDCIRVMDTKQPVKGVRMLNKHQAISWSKNTSHIWDLRTGELQNRFQEHQKNISGIEILNNGFVVSSSWDHTLKLWNPLSADLINTFQGHHEFTNII